MSEWDRGELPQPPDGLAARGEALWWVTVGEFELTATELVVLGEACRTVDVIDALAGEVAAAGVTVEGSRGQVRTHPGLMELRGHRGELRQLLDRLNLPDPEGADMRTGRQAKAERAARARWADVTPLRRDGHGA